MAGHLQTIWSARLAKDAQTRHRFEPQYLRKRVATPDGDFVDIDFQYTHPTQKSKMLWVMFHGLEGSSRSHYARAFAWHCAQNKIDFCVPHFRGCSGEINLGPRAYHSGDWQEIDWLLKHIKSLHPEQDLQVIGVSLGGNSLMRWAGEMEKDSNNTVKAIASICSPLDMHTSGKALQTGLNRYLYTPMFLKTMRHNALLKLAQYPNLFDKGAMLASKTLYEFDNVFTAPLHGFKDTNDYWSRASAKPYLHKISVSALAINSTNDPFIPAHSLPTKNEVSASVALWQPPYGGHVGFTTEYANKFPGHLQQLPRVIDHFFKTGETPIHG